MYALQLPHCLLHYTDDVKCSLELHKLAGCRCSIYPAAYDQSEGSTFIAYGSFVNNGNAPGCRENRLHLLVKNVSVVVE